MCVKMCVSNVDAHETLQARKASKVNTKRQAEIKLLLVIIIHCFFAFYVTTLSSLNSWKAPEVITEISTYFSCEAKGIQPRNSCLEVDFESYAIASLIPYVWISNITVINALYVINIHSIKTKVKTLIVNKLCLK